MELLTPILQAVGLFVATNIDDIIVLSLFYARGAGQRGTTRKILAGQYLGFGASSWPPWWCPWELAPSCPSPPWPTSVSSP
jgi:hypothetical protein